MTPSLHTSTLKSIVTEDFRAAAVFEKYSLDFCCKGGVTIDEACAARNVDASGVFADLDRLAGVPISAAERFGEWNTEALIDHILAVHHAYVREAIPVLSVHMEKVARVHGERHPELVLIAQHFATVAGELQDHILKEERVLFPYIRSLAVARREGKRAEAPHFGSAANPIRMMEAEHVAAGDTLYTVRSLSNNYTVPEDGCTTYRVTYQELRQFEEDLHRHVHLENNILFPSAIALEQASGLIGTATHA
jgi:regulator of cell morphogenesis and NO signaling